MDNNVLFEQAKLLRNILISRATGDKWDINHESEYEKCRKILMFNPTTKNLLPDFVKTNLDLTGFWAYIKEQSGTYAERRKFLNDEFSKLFLYLENGITFFDESVLRTTADYNN